MNKHSLLTISLLSLSFISLLSCSKNDSSKEPTVEPDAIINFPDATFKSLLSLHGKALTRDGITLIDTNNDGEIQIKEAQAYTGLLHVSGGIIGREITDLTGIEHFINITKLYAYNNKKLEKIDVSKNTQLTYLIAVGNGLTEINITKNTALEELHLKNNKLTQIDVSKNTQLTFLTVQGNGLTEIDITKNTQLTYLNAIGNGLTEIDITKNTALEQLHLNNNKLTQIDVSKNLNLKIFQVSGNQLTKLNIANGNNQNLSRFWASDNPNLGCIQIDADFVPPTILWFKDDFASYSSNCP